MKPPIVAPSEAALMLDFDGTLVPYASETRLVPVIDPRLPDLLERLAAYTNGATAIVSGRGVGELQSLLGPIRVPVFGTHGFEYRASPKGATELEWADQGAVDLLEGLDRLFVLSSAWAKKYRGISVERKALTLVLHFHDAPEMAEVAYRFARDVCEDFPDFALQAGRGVAEFRPATANKGSAISRLMSRSPFLGRKPVFIGDDLADEAGFSVVNSMKGISIKVGPGLSEARFSLASSAEVLSYLKTITTLP